MSGFEAREACRDLVVRAAACVDAQDFDGLAALFAIDGVLVRPDGSVLQGPDAIAAAYRGRPAGRITRHLVTNTVVELQDDRHATARSLVLLWSGQAGDAATAFGRPADPRQVVGEFDDRFRLTASGWRFARRDARFVLFKE